LESSSQFENNVRSLVFIFATFVGVLGAYLLFGGVKAIGALHEPTWELSLGLMSPGIATLGSSFLLFCFGSIQGILQDMRANHLFCFRSVQEILQDMRASQEDLNRTLKNHRDMNRGED